MQDALRWDALDRAVLAATSRETRKLLSAGAVLLRPEETVLEACLGGWIMQMESRNLTQRWIELSYKTALRFCRYTGEYPWNWGPGDLEAWASELLGKLKAPTVRGLQNHIGRFLDYLTDPAYGWAAVCEHYFGTHPAQICSEWNTVGQHALGDEPRPRSFTREELARLFEFCDSRIERAQQARTKGALAAARDSAMFKVQYAWGLRRREVCRLDVASVSENPRQPQFGNAGVLDVRWGKGSNGRGPKQRTVLTTLPWSARVLIQYIDVVRPCYRSGPELWVSERSQRVSETSYNERFAEYRDELGLDHRLTPHGLRRAYITHLLEDGWDLRFVQTQVGHAHASTTTIYSHVSNDFMTSTLNNALMDGAPEDLWNTGGMR
ncbi:tyrosine-type recombinase/integrase [Arthrobacter sp. GAS37]|uniref:tyrosine-type recombinase/integrase n=1 Tax=Arthrobacter sp. GAS37 TaxID=3156261 RepID=UPI0038510495